MKTKLGRVSRMVQFLVRQTDFYKQTESKLNKATSEASNANARAKRAEEENTELADRIADISQKLCRVEVQRSGRLPRLRVCVEIDSHILECGFMHGNDSTVIEYVGRDIGMRAAHEIRRANFKRYE